MNLKPLADRVIVKALSNEVITKTGIHIPDTAKEKPQEGRIIAAGPGKYDGDKLVPMSIKADDRVIYSKYAGTEIKFDGEEYLILRESDILAVFE
ncbi:MAG: co-chaperone GroES [Peptococcaceae bacterium]|nr:co-chaperone GroES [Peptococcaceae bacterium]